MKRKNFNVPDIKNFVKKDISNSNEKDNILIKKNSISKKVLEKNNYSNNKKSYFSKDNKNQKKIDNTSKIKENESKLKSEREELNKNLQSKPNEKSMNLLMEKISQNPEKCTNYNITSIRNSFQINNNIDKKQLLIFSRSVDKIYYKIKFNRFADNIKEESSEIINNSLSSLMDLHNFKIKIGKKNKIKMIQEKNEICIKKKKKSITKIFNKEDSFTTDNNDILSKSDGEIKRKTNMKNNITNKKDIIHNKIENNPSKYSKQYKNDLYSDIEKENTIFFNDKKINQNKNQNNYEKKVIDSQNIINGKMNVSANQELITKIKEATDEMLMKYDVSNLSDEKNENESFDEKHDSVNDLMEEDSNSDNLKLKERGFVNNSKYEKSKKDKNESFDKGKSSNILFNLIEYDNMNIEKIKSKIKGNIQIYGSSGLKNTSEKETTNSNKINSNLFNSQEREVPIQNNNHNFNNLDSNQDNIFSNDSKKNLLFYETNKKEKNLNLIENIDLNYLDINKRGMVKNHKFQKKNLNLNKEQTSPIKINFNIDNKKDQKDSIIERTNKKFNLNEIKKEINNQNKENHESELVRKNDNRNATSNFFNNNNNKLNKTGTMKLSKYKESRAYSGKIPIFNLQKQKIIISNAIPDYTKHFSTFNEILNGFFIPTDSKGFDAEGALRMVYENFKSLFILELKEENSNAKNSLINRNIVVAENELIKNRIRKVSEFLLNDQNFLSEERYYIFQKIQELQKKDSYNINFNNSFTDGNNKDELSEDINKNIEFFRKNKMFFRVVLSRPEIYDIMCYILGKRNEWRELPHGMLLGQSWNLLWTYSAPGINFGTLFTWQKVNHFINNRQLSRKDLLKKSIERIKKINSKLLNSFDIMPKTYILTREYIDFVEEFTRNKNSPHNLWIVKPVGKSRGRGIFLINQLCDVPMADSFLVQKYLTTPFLLEGYKFDLRIYVLLTSVNPLEGFLYKDGFARVSNMKFSMGNIENKLVHLTNAAIQNKHAARSQSYEKAFGGSKISLELLKQKMHRLAGVDFYKQIWPQIKTIVLKSLVACQHDMPYCPSSFELFGYDIIIDQDLKCWLLEVNSSPSLDRTSVLDDSIKLQLVDDILNLINPMNFDRSALIDVLERRLNINKSSASINKNISNPNNNVYLYSPSVQLNLDLNNIFKGEIPRSYGEMPKKMGNFEMIAPSDESNYLIKISGGEKKYNNKKT